MTRPSAAAPQLCRVSRQGRRLPPRPRRGPRAYYHCRPRRSGCCRADRDLGLRADDLSPAAREVFATARAVNAFGQAARLVGRMGRDPPLRVHLTESTACHVS